MSSFTSYTFRPIAECCMCGSSTRSHRVLGRRLNHHQGKAPHRLKGVSVTVCKCSNCGLIYSDPQPVPGSVQDHYDVQPGSYWQASFLSVPEDYFMSQVALAKKLLGHRAGLRALDIGAGLGYDMVALERGGFETHGFEPSAPFRDRAISHMGIEPDRLKLGSMEELEYPPDSFDLLNFGVVLEHLVDPGAMLAKSMKWLAHGGVVKIEVPSANWLTNRLVNFYYRLRLTDFVANISPMHKPYHFHEFTIKSFEEHGKRNGYGIAYQEFFVATTYLPKVLDPLLKPLMKRTNTGMQLSIWLRRTS